MLTGKQRSFLKNMSNSLNPIIQLGKTGITDNFNKEVNDALEARELIKIAVLNNSSEDVREAAAELAKKADAEIVQVIGRKITLYRKSKEPIITLP